MKNEAIFTTLTAALLLMPLIPADAGLLRLHKTNNTTSTVGASDNNTSVSQPGGRVSGGTGAAPQSSADLAGADDRVKRAKTQLDTAKKQLTASKALLKAAQAEYAAAQVDRQALALRTTAQGLANQSGLQSGLQPAAAGADSAGLPAAAGTIAPAPGSATVQSGGAGTDFGASDFAGGNATGAPGSVAADQSSSDTLR